jgi:hypothetical protein
MSNSKEARFPARMTCWTDMETARAFETLAARGYLRVSDFMRDALAEYARNRGLLRPTGNGAAHHQQANGAQQ